MCIDPHWIQFVVWTQLNFFSLVKRMWSPYFSSSYASVCIDVCILQYMCTCWRERSRVCSADDGKYAKNSAVQSSHFFSSPCITYVRRISSCDTSTNSIVKLVHASQLTVLCSSWSVCVCVCMYLCVCV